MKVMIVKELMTGDVSPVAMFFIWIFITRKYVPVTFAASANDASRQNYRTICLSNQIHNPDHTDVSYYENPA